MRGLLARVLKQHEALKAADSLQLARPIR